MSEYTESSDAELGIPQINLEEVRRIHLAQPLSDDQERHDISRFEDEGGPCFDEPELI